MTVAHLEPDVAEVAEVLGEPKAQRIEFCRQDRWIGYTRAMAVLRELEELLAHPKTMRPPNLLIVGASGNGKTAILDHFCSRHPVLVSPSGSPVSAIVRIEMAETPDESEFWSQILWSMGVSHRDKDSAAAKKRQAKTVMQYAQVRLLVIDEFNHLVNVRKTAPYLLAAIKGLSNDLKLHVVAAGTQPAINALNSDPQMKTRFNPCPLGRWALDAEYLRFLASYERLLPLAEPSHLASRELAVKIHGLARDTIGETVKLLKEAAVRAIDSGRERITAEVIDALEWRARTDWNETARVI